MPPDRTTVESHTPGKAQTPSESKTRKTVKHVDPLPKGSACTPCATRRVRCSGERPACSACIRHARWQGQKDHKCSYRAVVVEEEEEVVVDVAKLEEERELKAAKLKINELQLKLAALQARPSLDVHSQSSVAVATVSGYPDHSPPSTHPKADQSTPTPSTLLTSSAHHPTSAPLLSPDSTPFSPFFSPSFVAPSSLTLDTSSSSPNPNIDGLGLSFEFPFFTFTPPPSTDVSPMPTYHGDSSSSHVPTTLAELLSMPWSDEAALMDSIEHERKTEVKGEGQTEVSEWWSEPFEAGNDEMTSGASVKGGFGWY